MVYSKKRDEYIVDCKAHSPRPINLINVSLASKEDTTEKNFLDEKSISSTTEELHYAHDLFSYKNHKKLSI